MAADRLIIFGMVTVIGLGFWAASRMPPVTDLSSYNLASEEALARYEGFIQPLRSPNDGQETILILEKTTGWHTLADFQHLEELTDFWNQQPSINQAVSLATLPYPRASPLGPLPGKFLDLDNPEAFRLRVQHRAGYTDVFAKFLSTDLRYALIFTEAAEGLDDSSREAFTRLAQEQGITVRTTAQGQIEAALRATMERDTLVIAGISLLFILLGFWLFTHSLSGLVLIGGAIAFHIAATFGILVCLGLSFTLHMITIPAIIAVLSFTDIMHMLYHQSREVDHAATDGQLQQRILAQVRLPLLLTSATNLIGFIIYLLFAQNRFLFDYALAAIIGVTIAWASSRFLILRLITTRHVFMRRRDFSKLFRWHDRMAQGVARYRRWAIPGFVIVLVGLITLITATFRIDGTDQAYTLSDSSVTRGTEILQDHFFGRSQAEVLIHTTSGTIWEADRLRKLAQVEEVLTETLHPIAIYSPVLLARRLNRFRRGDDPTAFRIPDSLSPPFLAQLASHQTQLGGSSILDSTARVGRIQAGFGHLPLSEARAAYARIRPVLDSLSETSFRLELSGRQVLSEEATWQFSRKILIGLLATILGGSLLVIGFLGSLRKGIGILLVNLLPMLGALATMLVVNIPVTPLSLFFLAILLGVCVDDSIYLVTQFQRGEKRLHIIPIFVTTVVLGTGFLSLAWSSFTWLQPFGWIFLGGVSVAYLLDLFLLPLFLSGRSIFGADG